MSLIPWPTQPIAVWDFSETADEPLKNQIGVRQWAVPRLTGSFSKSSIEQGPFGPSLYLDGNTSYLYVLPPGDLLENSQYQSSFTVNFWAKSTSNGQAAAVSMHTEISPQTGAPARVWAMYLRQPFYGGTQRFSPHYGAQDGPTPGYPYNKDVACTGNQQVSQRWRMYTAVYEPGKLTAYVDGVASVLYDYVEPDPRPGYTLKAGPYNKNPYYVGRPINRSVTEKAFCIGGVAGHPFSGYTSYNHETGFLGGVGIFSGAWTQEQVMLVRQATLVRGGSRDAIFQVDWEVQTVNSTNANSSTDDTGATGWRSLRSRGYAGYRGASCADVSTTNTGGAFHIYHTASGRDYLRRTGSTSEPAFAGIVEGLGGIDVSEIQRLTFLLNNGATSVPAVRICVRVGDNWFASDRQFAMTGMSISASDWSKAENQVFDVNLSAESWRDMVVVPGSSLAVAASARTSPIPFGELRALGIWQPANSGGDLRVGALQVWNKTV